MNDSLPQHAATFRWSPRLLHALVTAPDRATAAGHLEAGHIPVFPCVPNGKRPLTTHGFHDASPNAHVIDSWWRRWPDANIGVPTGAAGGVDVVDVDIQEHGSGYPAFERARRAGLHAYPLHDSDAEQRSWQVPHEHVDFRGDGGYIVVPPSRVTQPDGTTETYRQIAVAEHHPGPVDSKGLRQFLDPPRSVRPPIDMPALGSRPDKLAAWVASRPEGGRNGGLFWAAFRMVEEGHDLGTTISVLGEAACAAGLPEQESMATIRSAYRTTRQRPGTAPRLTQAVEAVGP